VTPADHTKRFTAEVDALNGARRTKLRALGKRARKIIVPYFSEHKLTYQAGNGDWCIEDTAGNFIDDDDLPTEIRELLMVEVAYGDHLGFYIEDIKPTDWKVAS
jgi:hypothetical protein